MAADRPRDRPRPRRSLERRVAERAIRWLHPLVGGTVRGAGAVAAPAARRRARRVPGDRVPFVVLTAARSGSTLLTGLLDDHPRIAMAGELLNHRNPIRHAHPTAREHELLRPARLLHRRVYTVPDVDAAGFKLFYHHGMGTLPTAWAYLEGLQRLHVVHLRRRDELARYVSLERAMRDGRWTREEEGPAAERTPLTVDVEHFVRWATTWRARREEALARLGGKPMLEVWFEDLATAREVELGRVFGFLGVDPAPVSSPLRRQRTRPLAEEVANWDEVVDAVDPWRWVV